MANEKITPKQPFNGFYVGAFAGMGNRKVETSFDTSRIDKLPLSYKIDYTKWRKFRGFIGGAFVGYGTTQNQFYVGGELSAHYEDLNKKTKHHAKASASGVDQNGRPVNVSANGDMELTYKRSPVISPALRMGYTPDSDKLIYMRLGAEVSRDKLEEKHTGTTTVGGASRYSSGSESTKTSTKVTFVPGIGFEQAYGHCIFRVEYTYNLGASIKQKGSDDNLVPTTSKYTQHSIKLGVAYQF